MDAITSAVSPYQAPTLAPVVDTIHVDVEHVRDKEGEILVKIGDKVTQDQLIADLVSYRASLPTATPLPPVPREAPTATWQPDPVIC